ncbi:MAG: NAD(P)/FAD-dependent oxidoreductase [Deltaproteobacteria bacterium]|nr:NAD(P)/FAD-dependent oxidoreductase [Deltaproteobacteria bacterium]MBW2686676.1 NAD(P)/FAD-dependent oxidoreductase [Deltaproteobacteria bacterium]
MTSLFWEPNDKNPGPPYLGEKNLAKERYKRPDKLLADPDMIVIGSGIGGLSIASILAQKKNARVLLLEANTVPGGATHCHEIGGFEWNSGVDSIGDMDPRKGRGLFRPTIDYVTGGQLQWAKMPDVHEVSTLGEEVYQWYSSAEKNIAWVQKKFPGQGDIRKYYRLEAAIEWAAWCWTLTKLFPSWVPESFRELFYRIFGGKWRQYMLQTTNDVYQRVLGFSRHLTTVYTYMYGNHGATPDHSPFAFHAVNLLHYRDGAYYPVGGPGQIAECVIPIIEKAGGQLAVGCPVQRILVEDGRTVGVRLESGEEIRCNTVISDASAYTTYMELLEPELRDSLGFPEKFTRISPSPGHCWLFLGYDEAIDLPKQIFWEMPQYTGVDRLDLDAADIEYKQNLRFDGMAGYLLSPSSRDPVYAQRYPNKSTVIVLAEAPSAWINRAKDDPEWKATIDTKIGDNLEKIVHRHMPVLKDKQPVFRRSGFPMGCNPRAWGGGSLGLEPSGARFVEHTHWLRPQTPIKGLWLTGQDPFSAGFSGSMLSARVTYAAMTGNWLSLLFKKM